ncbi:MAG: hypothetical protein RMM08_00935 [Armatimonadota bacterium]|nr:hypothetical protein [bacterium]MDW8319899.1 hypothetical protein [Armatimonadota bacterium]
MSFYRVIKQEGTWWFLSPKGERFFSLGVNCVNMGEPEYSGRNPAYCALRFYPDAKHWTEDTLSRLREWGFNTIGGWSDIETLRQHWKEHMPYTVVLHVGSRLGMPWNDMFHPQTAHQVDEIVRELTAPYREDPHLLGWFTDNELGWWDDSLFLHFLKQPPQNTTRHKMIELLRRHYRHDIHRVRADFDIGDAKRFEDIQQVTLVSGGRGMEVINRFTFLLAQRYYQLMHDAIRRYDRNHLILGDRYHDFYPLEVARASARYVDVVSTNHGADWIDGSNSHYFFYTLNRITGKPVLVTEFYFCAHENRSGNRNTPPNTNFPTVQTQRERANGARTNVADYAQRPYLIGAHWFQYYDEPTFGRSDGENYNMGLIDIHNQPYEQLVVAFRSVVVNRIHAEAESASPRSQICIPRAEEPPLDGLHGWDKTVSWIPPDSQHPVADLYVCWQPSHLFIALHATDWVDASLYPQRKIPREERMHCRLKVRIVEERELTVWFGDVQPTEVSDQRVEVKSWNVATRYTVVLKIPAQLLGVAEIRQGESTHLRGVLFTHSRAEQTTWNKRLVMGD